MASKEIAKSEDRVLNKRSSWATVAAVAGAAAIVGAVTLGINTAFDLFRPLHIFNRLATTAVGQIDDVGAGNGTRVQLNTDSKARLRYGEDAREVELLDGEAALDVTADPARPFSLKVGSRRVDISEGRFNVRKTGPNRATLTVFEGEARLDPDTKIGPQSSADLQSASAQVTPVDSGKLEAIGAWQQEEVHFTAETIEAVLAEMNRYSEYKYIADDSLRNLRISGTYRVGDVQGVLDTLREHWLIRQTRRDHQILLTALPNLGLEVSPGQSGQ
jgi:transmembrane sensor